MSQYHFFPFLRQGLAGKILTEDTLGAGGTTYNERASIDAKVFVDVTNVNSGAVSSNPITQNLKIKGPGDITGINSDQIIKVTPQDWVTNMEPFYLPYIEFYDEDFPWRYTPAAAKYVNTDRYRLRPWLTLVVLKETEFTAQPFNGLLDVIQLNSAPSAIFPNQTQLWAWAHVHVNDKLDNATSGNIVQKLTDKLKTDPDKGLSRIICPRRLDPFTNYHAFLIPTFETGRLAGLNNPTFTATIPTTDAMKPSWDASSPANLQFPVYYKWFFKTGSEKGFEALVRMLKPKAIPNTVGKRDIDLQLPGDQDIDTKSYPTQSIGLPGVLQPPTATPDPWSNTPFTEGLRTTINRPADSRDSGTAGPDPIISPPIYGQWHAMTDKLTGAMNANWIHSANLEPRLRMFAGAGAEVIRKNQDRYMQIAWQQVGEIIEANKKLKHLQIAQEASSLMYAKHYASLSNETILAVSGPLHTKVKFATNVSVYKQIDGSVIPNDMFSGAFRRLTRPASSMMRTLRQVNAATDYDSLVADVNSASVAVAAPYTPPTAMISYSIWPSSALTSSYTLSLPTSSSFSITMPGSPVAPPVIGPPSTAAAAFSTATAALHSIISGMPGYSFSPGNVLNISGVVTAIKTQTNPNVAVTNLATKQIQLYNASTNTSYAPASLYPVMAAPKILLPMYKDLAGLSVDWMMPGLNTIEQNSINALTMSQANIEAFMLGLNHEMSRELLWRGYPTDQRGTYFQFFWGYDSSMISVSPSANLDNYKDIKPIHTWPVGGFQSEIGAHTSRALTNTNDLLILVIRGELLKKYPGTIIYMQPAEYQKDANNNPLYQKSRVPIDNPIYPVFSAKLDPDIYFIGFDIKPADARGTDNNAADAGYFFVFQERAGELQFGADELDTTQTGTNVSTWDDLNWQHILNNNVLAGASNAFIDLNDLHEITNPSSTVKWARNSANMAHILFQKPVKLNVHAKELIPAP